MISLLLLLWLLKYLSYIDWMTSSASLFHVTQQSIVSMFQS